ncbi:C-type lectin domain-containing protein [Trichostrongylus colubriformis]|uniref:C-type lectin domain-containing protein n=1 Tax=Trichostrongylus colubriformis TaxID=6319 RepID=A0AAN8IJ77_TRICO
MSIRVLFVASSVVLVLTADNVAVHETFAFDEKSNVRPIFVAGHQDGWTILGKYVKAYKVIGGKKTWAEADKACKSKGAQLASIMNKEENDFIWDIAKSVSERTGPEGRIWIGGKKKCGSWKWTDGTKWDYENWDSGEPNNEGGHEDCLQILAHPQRKGKWNDAPCDGKLAFVCEK